MLGNTRHYRSVLGKSIGLPDGLDIFSHSADWPIDPMGDDAQIATYFGWLDYIVPDRVHFHPGIDIQADEGSPVRAPEDLQVRHYQEFRGLADIFAQGLETGLLYAIGHLDPNSVFHFCNCKWERHPNTRIRRDAVFAKVGRWPEPIETFNKPKDALERFGESYNHIHISVLKGCDEHDRYMVFSNPDNYLDPVRVLKLLPFE